MRKRTVERRLALEILFAQELNPQPLEKILESRKLARRPLPNDFGLKLIKGVLEHKKELDRLIDKYAQNWRVERMPLTDRNILRLALYEIVYENQIPYGVSINEAVELAKLYGTEDSGRFVNGVLGKVVREEFAYTERDED
jgi:N utilization substance protein B